MSSRFIHVCACRSFLVPVIFFAAVTGVTIAHAANPPFVDLRAGQTAIRSQHGHNCYIYATVAALEARLKREGYGDLDLSEAFSDYLGALFFLESCEMDGTFRTTRMRVPAAGERETSLAVDYQSSIESATPCVRLRIPEERYFPSVISVHPPDGPAHSFDPHWARQFDVNTHNLDPRRLPRSALTAPLYYGIEELTWLPREDAKNPDAIERILAQGDEVIWDFKSAGNQLADPWQYTVPEDPMGAGHRMLLVGYDRRDPANAYFIAKNSWGPTTNAGAQGFTRISYDYVRYGLWASYIQRIRVPAPWPELPYLGRWEAQLGDRAGVLDLYHLPGLMRDEFTHNQYRDRDGGIVRDQRLGTFFEGGDPARAFHVNGNVSAGLIQLWIDFEQPTRRWDELTGALIEMRVSGEGAMAGRMTDAAGRGYDANARLAAFVPAAPAVGPDSGATDLVPTEVRQAIMTAWQKEMGAGGPLGAASGDIFPSGEGAWMQVFANGKIVHSKQSGTTVIVNASW